MPFNKDIASVILSYLGYFGYEDLFEEMFPGSRVMCEKMNIVKSEDIYYGIAFTLFDKLHRTDGPARIWNDKETNWYYGNKVHRIDGPAVENSRINYKAWYNHGLQHRIGGPAVEYENRVYKWYYHGKLIKREF
jgi:hypothetical protein